MPDLPKAAVIACDTKQLHAVAQSHMAKCTSPSQSWSVVSLASGDLFPYLSALESARHRAANLSLMIQIPHAESFDDLVVRDLVARVRRTRQRNATYVLGYSSRKAVHPIILDMAQCQFAGDRS